MTSYIGSQSFGASSNFANSNPGATVQPTNVQSPVLSAACQASGRHDRLRLLAGRDVGAEPKTPLPVIVGDLQGQRAAGVIVPDLHRIDAMPVRAFAARQQKIDRGRARAAVGVRAGIAKRLAIMPAFRMRLEFEPRDDVGRGR